MAKIYLEVEVEVTGSLQKAEPDVGISDSYFDEITIERAAIIVSVFKNGKRVDAPHDFVWTDQFAALVEDKLADEIQTALFEEQD